MAEARLKPTRATLRSPSRSVDPCILDVGIKSYVREQLLHSTRDGFN